VTELTAVGPAATQGQRGRPRSERVRSAVLAAAAELLVECGIDAVTVEAIAARAGVSKTTIYRWWPSRGHVMLESFFSSTRDTIAVAEDASLEESLVSQVAALARLFGETRSGPLMGDLVAAAQADAEIRAALEERWLRPRRRVAAGLLHAAVDRGELDPRLDVGAAVDQLFAPVYHRLLFGHEPLHAALAETLVRQLLAGLRHPPADPSAPPRRPTRR
jgi:AcrR family transcriptional regulator